MITSKARTHSDPVLKLFVTNEVEVIKQIDADVPRARDIAVPSHSGDFNGGRKCFHGVFIPGNVSGDRAPHCSCCHPYIISVKAAA